MLGSLSRAAGKVWYVSLGILLGYSVADDWSPLVVLGYLAALCLLLAGLDLFLTTRVKVTEP